MRTEIPTNVNQPHWLNQR